MNSVTLTIASGPVAGRTRRVDPGHKLMVGRGESADFSVMDLRMSREHCQVLSSSGEWRLRDLDSTHGTMVNGKRVNEVKLREGDVIEAGDTQFRVTFGDDDIRVDDSSVVPQPQHASEASKRRTWTAGD